MFFSLMLIFMCCVNTDERLFLFTQKNETIFYIHNELVRRFKYRTVNSVAK